ncbi:MAG: 6-carboxytetrahydropterin synthase [Bdellovibrionota bacterium]
MSKVILCRRARFSASHRLHSPMLSDAENISLFGKCNNPNGHGHNYQIFVRLAGHIDPKTGMVISLTTLEELIDQHVIKKLDHKHLNHDVDFLKGMNPTSENLVVAIWQQLQPHIPDGLLYEIELIETENNTVCYRGE